MLLAEHGYAYTAEQKVVAIAVGIVDSEDGMRAVASLHGVEHGLSLTPQFRFLGLRLACQAPGVEEVEPVDVGTDIVYVVIEALFHLNSTFSPRLSALNLP